MDSVRWGIIGVGDVTEAKSGPGFQASERSELVAVMRRDGAKAADYARRHQVPRWYDDADALLADPAVDAVYVATPPDSHRDYTLRALAAGKPVYVEKPMARTTAECEQMLAAADRAGLPLFVAYYRRAMPRFARVREILDGGAIGRVHAFRVENFAPAPSPVSGEQLPWRLRPEIAGGGLFVDLASHTLDLLDHLLGPVARVHGVARNVSGLGDAEDTVSATFEAGGAVGTGLWCFATGESRDVVEIIGTSGSVTFSSFGQEPLVLRRGAQVSEIEAPYPATVQQPLIQAVVDELTGHGTSPSTGLSALRTARVVDEVLGEYRREQGLHFD
ncbi:Gfo/Idh/MocA family oxidoreductase [Ruania suaedae]|uniref:Gfo/Idh/MocA family protein n=1 Tax=Ruania suaedae TaxID=2897774 RepID=UPI001E3218A8|nr:Gfo/Idh/MocA family oxidoreductase [Ruania suaedae]UFU04374.1 Gfo/Idh/MocA family oxidoreductase [Ruania suaedae]